MEQTRQDFIKGLNQSVALIKNPAEWENIRAGQVSLKDFYLQYILPFAAIPPIAAFLGNIRVFGVVRGLAFAIGTYVVSLIAIYLISLAVQKLSPKFNGNPSLVESTKWIAYSMSPMFLGGILSLLGFVGLGWLAGLAQFLLACYGIYLLYKGIGPMTSVPEDKRILFLVVVLVVCFVIQIAIGMIIMTTILGGIIASAAVPGVEGIGYRG